MSEEIKSTTYSNSGNNYNSNNYNKPHYSRGKYNKYNKYNNKNYYNNGQNSGNVHDMNNNINNGNMMNNFQWPGYYVPQMYYMTPGMSTMLPQQQQQQQLNVNPGLNLNANDSLNQGNVLPQNYLQPQPIQPQRQVDSNNLSPPPSRKIEITTKSGEKLDLHSLHKTLSPQSRDSDLSSTNSNVTSNNSSKDSLVSKESKKSTDSNKDNDSNDKLTQAEINKKAFLEQVRLRKKLIDQKKMKIKDSNGNLNEANDDKIKTLDENKILKNDEVQIIEAINSETEITTEKDKNDHIDSELINNQIEEKSASETKTESVKPLTFAEKLKLKQSSSQQKDNKDEGNDIEIKQTDEEVEMKENLVEETNENENEAEKVQEEQINKENQKQEEEEEEEEKENQREEEKENDVQNKINDSTGNKLKESENVVEEETAVIDPNSPESITTLIDRLAKLPSVNDIYEFPYPNTVEKPDPKYKKVHVKYTYGPAFLLQFKDHINYKPDTKWVQTTQSKIVILPTMAKQRVNKVNFSGSIRSNDFRNASTRNMDRSNSRNMSKRQSSKKYDKSNRSTTSYTSRRERMENYSKRENKAEDVKPPVEEVAPLVPSANRWVPKSRVKKTEEKKIAPDGVTELLDLEEVKRKMKALLNKLTLEKFDPISAEIITMANQSQWETNGETLNNVIEQIYLKACDEPYWSSMYAQLCGKIVKDLNESIVDEKYPGKIGPKLVLHYLVARCHTEFEKGWTDKLPTNEDGSPLEPEMMSDEYYVLAAAKRRGLGLVRFIGFLYRLNLLTGKMMFECFRRLMKDLTEKPTEETLESLVELLTTVGEQFENDKFSSGRGSLSGSVLFDKLFQLIQIIIDAGEISNRIKFKLIDVKELREDKHWNSVKKDQGPKTIQQIHDEDEKERQEKLSNSRASSRRGPSGYSKYNNNSSYSNNNNGNSGGYSNNSNYGNRTNFRNESARNTPSNRYNSNARSSIKEEKPKPRPAVTMNMFDALSNRHEDD